eukprot:447071-Rhodomonas_salina.3
MKSSWQDSGSGWRSMGPGTPLQAPVQGAGLPSSLRRKTLEQRMGRSSAAALRPSPTVTQWLMPVMMLLRLTGAQQPLDASLSAGLVLSTAPQSLHLPPIGNLGVDVVVRSTSSGLPLILGSSPTESMNMTNTNGEDYLDAFAPVPRATASHILMVLAAGGSCTINSLDITQAFIQSKWQYLPSRIFITPPDSVNEEEGVVYKGFVLLLASRAPCGYASPMIPMQHSSLSVHT